MKLLLGKILTVEKSTRPHIYQLMVRHFGNTNETRKHHGTMAENGCGKFNDINDAALKSLKQLGITHIWLTGVLEQASSTTYPDRPADFSPLVKGKAGSPYAIRDYFDVCPDYAAEPDNRLDEFQELLQRINKHGLKTLIDFVPNHVARSYSSDIRPELSFGKDDDTSQFFSADNNFYYLGDLHPGGGAPVELPTKDGPLAYPPESTFGRVTGNNVISWAPSANDWFETIKLNYGHNFTLGPPRDDIHPLPHPNAQLQETPNTWQKMDAILAYWQKMGVDGFRVDMAHMVPMHYWAWQIQRCRQRNTHAFFMAEAYDNDPSKLTSNNVLDALLENGFDAVYDDPSYDTIKNTVEGSQWANDIDDAAQLFSPRFHQSIRYAENHDEVRLASKQNWNGIGADIGRPVTALLFGMGRGPIMIYNGQELGEKADKSEGFSGDDGRSSIFDYGSLPSLVPWINNHLYNTAKLTDEQKQLRDFYTQLLHLCREPAFTQGNFYGLNHTNKNNPAYGRMEGEAASGHYLYSYLRHDDSSDQTFLVVANLQPEKTLENTRIQIPEHALEWIHKSRHAQANFTFTNKLGPPTKLTASLSEIIEKGLLIPHFPSLSAMYLELT